MCQFTRLYPSGIVEELIQADKVLESPTLEKVLSVTDTLNKIQFGQEAPAQIQSANNEDNIIMQEVSAQIEDGGKALTMITRYPIPQIENSFICSPISKINWASIWY